MTDAYRSAETERRREAGLLIGVVTLVDFETRRAVVEIEDDWSLAPLPWIEARAGRTRTSSPPSIGEQVIVLSPSGDPAFGLILKGVPSDAHTPSEVREGLELIETEAGYSDRWDEDAKVRTIDIPEGGKLIISLAGTAMVTAEGDTLTLSAGGAEIVLTDGKITLDGDVVLGGAAGGAAVARVGDTIDTVTKKIITGATKAKAV